MTEPIVVGVALRDDDAAPLAITRDLARFMGAPLALVRIDPREPPPSPSVADDAIRRIGVAFVDTPDGREALAAARS
jgi:hypothetical protein